MKERWQKNELIEKYKTEGKYHNEGWIDKKKFEVAIIKVSELGKMVGGLVKFYAKNYQKSV